MTFSIQPLPLDGPLFEGAIDVYSRAFALPPYSDPGRGEEIRSRMTEVHKDRAGFRAFCACIPGSEVVGMIYGYHGQPGQWWHDTVLRELKREAATSWLGDSYELVEVAVDPDYQDRGIGALLIGHLLERAPGSGADGDVRARFGERERNGPADALTCSGDEGRFPLERVHRPGCRLTRLLRRRGCAAPRCARSRFPPCRPPSRR